MGGDTAITAGAAAPWWLHAGTTRLDGAAAVVAEAWATRVGPAVLATVGDDGQPNLIYTKFIRRYDATRFVIADNLMGKTFHNIQAGSTGALLFLTRAGRSFQLKGGLQYHQQGPLFEDMKSWNPPHLNGRAAVVLVLEEVYTGADRLA